jgi:hypothetical protein
VQDEISCPQYLDNLINQTKMKYWFHPEMSWKLFKKLTKPYQGDIVPEHGDRVLWEMLRDRKINMYFSDNIKDKSDPIIITTNPVKGGKMIKELTKQK